MIEGRDHDGQRRMTVSSVKTQGSGATISIGDFMTGFLASLAEHGVTSVSLRGAFYQALREAFKVFRDRARGDGHEIDFVVNTHPVHGDSPMVRMAITQAVQRDLISLDNPVYLDMRLKISPFYAEEYISDLPGSPDLYREMTQKFIDEFEARTAS